MRERTPSADSAAGMGRGRAQPAPPKAILAAKRKIPGVWGQRPQVKMWRSGLIDRPRYSVRTQPAARSRGRSAAVFGCKPVR